MRNTTVATLCAAAFVFAWAGCVALQSSGSPSEIATEYTLDPLEVSVPDVELVEPPELKEPTRAPREVPLPPLAIPPPPDFEADLRDALLEIRRLESRIGWLETELALAGSEVTRGPFGRWLSSLSVAERPGERTLRLMAEALEDYPVELAAHEGLWVAERIREDDWLTWGPTVDEALILYLGPERLVRELEPAAIEALREDWSEEGYFPR